MYKGPYMKDMYKGPYIKDHKSRIINQVPKVKDHIFLSNPISNMEMNILVLLIINIVNPNPNRKVWCISIRLASLAERSIHRPIIIHGRSDVASVASDL